MTQSDGRDGVGYVICGYLDETGPAGVTAEGEPYSGRPYSTIEEAVAEIDANGGPRKDANIFVGAIVPVALIVQPDEDPDRLLELAEDVMAEFGSFYADEDGGGLIREAGKGHNAASQALNFAEGPID